MKKFRLFAILLSVGLIGGFVALSGCKKSGDGKAAAAKQAKFHCPMHPTYTSDKPGDCPICGMRLVPIESQEAHEQAVQAQEHPAGHTQATSGSESTAPRYQCPMHPNVTSDKPGKCPICGMDLVPMKAEPTAPPAAATGVPGQAPVSIPVSRAQTIGVRVEPVTVRELASVIRASARVAYDPELFSAITEHKQALTTKEKVKESPWPDVQERADALIRASGLRLRQLGLSQNQIDQIASTEGDPTTLLLGQGGSVWVYAQIYEYELPRVKQGQTAEISSSAFPGRVFRGTVRSVSPVLNPETRSARVLIDVPDPEGLFRPEMYVDAAIQAPLGRKLAIPAEAIMDTGTRQLVFVETGPGKFEPREVRVGQLAQGFRPVLSGLKDGEKVVVSGNFLIDSESKLKAALSQPGGHQH